MKSNKKEISIALRFSDNFAPEAGTIRCHQDLIQNNGYVWYGKLGSAVSDKVIKTVLENDRPRILLIHSGKTDRYWAYIEDISKSVPPEKDIPSYYRSMRGKFKTWFKITRLEIAPKNILSKCYVKSSRTLLGETSKHSMSPYFIIEMENEYE